MYRRSYLPQRPHLLYAAAFILGLMVVAILGAPAQAQVIQQAVGGVSVNVDGVLSNVDAQHGAELREARQKAMQPVPGDMSQTGAAANGFAKEAG